MNKESMTPVTIITAGDLAPTFSNYSFFESGNIGGVVEEELLNKLSSVDFRIFNLEVPLTDNNNPISKDGPALKAPLSVIKGIKLLDPSVLSLANNHIMDHGEQGLSSTLELLAKNSIKYVGAGIDIKEASGPIILEKEGTRIGIYACAEHEFSIAGENHAGANPIDLLESFDHIENLKSDCDFVIVLHHGGKEYYRYPSPDLRKVCRKMVSKGADLVVCQHSHSVGSYEYFNDGVIVYGQGNFLFDRHDDEFWQSGLLVKATFREKMEVDFLPISKKGNGVELPDPVQSDKILSEFHKRSGQISIPGFVEEEYEKYCLNNGQYYLATLAGLGKTVRRADKLLNRPLTRLIYSRKKLEILRNHFECETHRELILKYIQILTRERLK
jgi:poly-gamma-glutamate synthesis protein (capsule biosynthesis protein)